MDITDLASCEYQLLTNSLHPEQYDSSASVPLKIEQVVIHEFTVR